MSDKKLDAIKIQIKTELDSMILKEFGDDSRLTGLNDSEKITAVIADFNECVKRKNPHGQRFYAPETKERITFEFEGFKVETYHYVYNLFRLLHDDSRLHKEYRAPHNPKKRTLPAYDDSFFRMAVDYLECEDYESLQSLNELKPDMLVVAENKNSKSEQFGRIFLAVKKAGKFYYYSDPYNRGNELMNNEKVPFAEVSLQDFFDSKLCSAKEEVKAIEVCDAIPEIEIIPTVAKTIEKSNKSEIFKAAHAMAKKINNGLNYSATFAQCLKFVYMNAKKTVKGTIERIGKTYQVLGQAFNKLFDAERYLKSHYGVA